MKREPRAPEQKAIRQCRMGRVEGLQGLYELFGSRVHRTCFRILGDRSAADDATQEIFLRVFRRIETFREESSFSTWIYRLAVNYSLDLLRARKRLRLAEENGADPLPALPDLSPSHEQKLMDAEQARHARRLLASLPPEARAILVLREMEEMSYREISEVLEIPMGTVMSRLSRSRAELRQRWQEAAEGRPTPQEQD